jgi:hypothetical protein
MVSGPCPDDKVAVEQGLNHYCHTDIAVDSNDITAQVSGEQEHYFHL